MDRPLRVLVVGCGNMGSSHARAYHRLPEFEVAGLVSRNPALGAALSGELGGVPQFARYAEALAATRPDVVSINTYPDTHAAYARAALDAGCHVFCEKPLATTVEDAVAVVQAARAQRRKLVVGYILRVHPAWKRFVEAAQSLGKPLVMRMNLNQQSHGAAWATHLKLMESASPVVDCGVHYVDVMCQMTGARPVRVSAIAARLSDDVRPGNWNYGQLQVAFDDGSVGWYESGWGPMMSETAFFVKDVVGPRGSVSIVAGESAEGDSDALARHTRSNCLRVHHAETDSSGAFARADELVSIEDDPDHGELCVREQQWLLRAIREDLDLSADLDAAVNSLRIVLASDESVRRGEVIRL